MKRVYFFATSFAIILFLSMPVWAISDSSDLLSLSQTDMADNSDSSSDSSAAENDRNIVWGIELTLNILGSGFFCALLTYYLNRRNEQKLRIIAASDTLYAAFNAAFPDNFLERDDSNLSAFRIQYTHFCNTHNSLIELIKKNKYGLEISKNLTADCLIGVANTTSYTLNKEDRIRRYMGEQYSLLTGKILGL